jgi:hypothetical protein
MREIDFAFAVTRNVSVEFIVTEPIDGFSVNHFFASKPIKGGVIEPEVLNLLEDATGAGNYSVPSASRKMAGENFEHAFAISGA